MLAGGRSRLQARAVVRGRPMVNRAALRAADRISGQLALHQTVTAAMPMDCPGIAGLWCRPFIRRLARVEPESIRPETHRRLHGSILQQASSDRLIQKLSLCLGSGVLKVPPRLFPLPRDPAIRKSRIPMESIPLSLPAVLIVAIQHKHASQRQPVQNQAIALVFHVEPPETRKALSFDRARFVYERFPPAKEESH